MVNLPNGIFHNKLKGLGKYLAQNYQGRLKLYSLSDDNEVVKRYFEEVEDWLINPNAPPLFDSITKFVRDLNTWLNGHTARAACVYCCEKKSRAGMLLCCWLIEAREASSMSLASSFVASLCETVQLRYMSYYEQFVRGGTKPATFQRRLVLEKIVMHTVPMFGMFGGCTPWFSIKRANKTLFYSKSLDGKKGRQVVEFDCCCTIVTGDIQIEFYDGGYLSPICNMFFHTNFIEISNRMLFTRKEIDGAHKDNNGKHFYPDFSLDLVFKQVKQKKKLTLEEIFNSPEYLDSLRQFMIKSLCLENLNFYEAVLHYKRAHALQATPQKEGFLKEIARNIYNHYVRKGAPEEVNIDGHDKDIILENLGDATVDLFDNAISSVVQLLKADILPKFLISNVYNQTVPSKSMKLDESVPDDFFACARCFQRIHDNEGSVPLNDNHYHWGCIACSLCNATLDAKNNDSCVFRKGLPVCAYCEDFFPKCVACGLNITGYCEEIPSTPTKPALVFHRTCVYCCICFAPPSIAGTLQWWEPDFYCEMHISKASLKGKGAVGPRKGRNASAPPLPGVRGSPFTGSWFDSPLDDSEESTYVRDRTASLNDAKLSPRRGSEPTQTNPLNALGVSGNPTVQANTVAQTNGNASSQTPSTARTTDKRKAVKDIHLTSNTANKDIGGSGEINTNTSSKRSLPGDAVGTQSGQPANQLARGESHGNEDTLARASSAPILHSHHTTSAPKARPKPNALRASIASSIDDISSSKASGSHNLSNFPNLANPANPANPTNPTKPANPINPATLVTTATPSAPSNSYSFDSSKATNSYTSSNPVKPPDPSIPRNPSPSDPTPFKTFHPNGNSMQKAISPEVIARESKELPRSPSDRTIGLEPKLRSSANPTTNGGNPSSKGESLDARAGNGDSAARLRDPQAKIAGNYIEESRGNLASEPKFDVASVNTEGRDPRLNSNLAANSGAYTFRLHTSASGNQRSESTQRPQMPRSNSHEFVATTSNFQRGAKLESPHANKSSVVSSEPSLCPTYSTKHCGDVTANARDLGAPRTRTSGKNEQPKGTPKNRQKSDESDSITGRADSTGPRLDSNPEGRSNSRNGSRDFSTETRPDSPMDSQRTNSRPESRTGSRPSSRTEVRLAIDVHPEATGSRLEATLRTSGEIQNEPTFEIGGRSYVNGDSTKLDTKRRIPQGDLSHSAQDRLQSHDASGKAKTESLSGLRDGSRHLKRVDSNLISSAPNSGQLSSSLDPKPNNATFKPTNSVNSQLAVDAKDPVYQGNENLEAGFSSDFDSKSPLGLEMVVESNDGDSAIGSHVTFGSTPTKNSKRNQRVNEDGMRYLQLQLAKNKGVTRSGSVPPVPVKQWSEKPRSTTDLPLPNSTLHDTGTPIHPQRGNEACFASCFKGKDLCLGCKEFIEGKFLRAEDMKFHLDCFKCRTCHLMFNENFDYYKVETDDDANFFCKVCMEKGGLL